MTLKQCKSSVMTTSLLLSLFSNIHVIVVCFETSAKLFSHQHVGEEANTLLQQLECEEILWASLTDTFFRRRVKESLVPDWSL